MVVPQNLSFFASSTTKELHYGWSCISFGARFFSLRGLRDLDRWLLLFLFPDLSACFVSLLLPVPSLSLEYLWWNSLCSALLLSSLVWLLEIKSCLLLEESILFDFLGGSLDSWEDLWEETLELLPIVPQIIDIAHSWMRYLWPT